MPLIALQVKFVPQKREREKKSNVQLTRAMYVHTVVQLLQCTTYINIVSCKICSWGIHPSWLMRSSHCNRISELILELHLGSRHYYCTYATQKKKLRRCKKSPQPQRKKSVTTTSMQKRKVWLPGRKTRQRDGEWGLLFLPQGREAAGRKEETKSR